MNCAHHPVIPAKAGTQGRAEPLWVPAFAGMTTFDYWID